MQLTSFTIHNYRSITTAYKLPVSEFTVLVGPNNEGKSNILRALVTSLDILSRSAGDLSRRRRVIYRRSTKDHFRFDWEQDFPISLQSMDENGEGRSEFVLEFKLNEKDKIEFKEEVGSDLNTNLNINLLVGQEQVEIKMLIEGSDEQTLEDKIPAIASFIGKRIEVQYIPAIRPSNLALNVVEELLSRELALLEKDEDYKKLLDAVYAAQRPILDKIGHELTKTISGFVPEVEDVIIDSEQRLYSGVRRSPKVLINDGTLTDLESKGDGIKSLTAISLLKHISQAALSNKSLILAIEEPESHLHPGAIHKLRQVLQELSNTHQVILTTHSPALADKIRPSSNIIVKSGKGSSAFTLTEVRDALGVQVSDNLSGAYLVILVEGPEDKRILLAWLPLLSEKIKIALAQGIIAIDDLGGATNLSYKTKLYKTQLCNVYAFLDDDDAGRKSIESAESSGALEISEYTLASCQGMRDSEFEDLIEFKVYEEKIKEDYGVILSCKPFNNNRYKWSDRVKECFQKQGKIWSTAIESRVKDTVAKEAVSAGLAGLNPHRRSVVDAFVTALESRLKNI